ncbi:hypothetical protein [Tranquillimonas alkanivorans]|uniref:Tetratricopeptide repeat-like domain-containing protein n=1 Tax=Tranquillimonas alkanivorans TaxID=441119 RepID=A0A1I5NT68_9RHOB|nr:hypothetical protein [Tranquillimonas alkanivorans]SFP24421.1 hypothetical protein SAMN04488047_10447 [Tranquillimonas alkanivorans]
MSNQDSFIEEVSEEVRRDRLFAIFRRYGWIAITLVVLLVAAAAWNEWRKASERAEAQALGSAILAALEQPDAAARRAALAEIEANQGAEAVIALLAAGEIEGEESRASAVEALEAMAADADLAPVYRDLAVMKIVLLDGDALSPEERIARLEPLTIAGAPFRLLALEQTALAQVEAGNDDEAIAIARDLLAEDGVSEGLRRRLSQLIVALGGSLDAA